ncbi:MAG: outer membrane lipoprotein-sorting protein [Ghiorsea sp.]
MNTFNPLSKHALVLGLATLVAAPLAWAETPEEKGLAIAIEADKRDTGFGDYSVNLQMTLRNAHGQETSRSMRNKTREQANDGDKTLIVFDNPRDVKGTAFLSHTHKLDADDQWLFLPALKRVKRISSSNKSGPFMGSEFAYEDISSQEVEKYTYKYQGEEVVDGRANLIVERFPTNAKSGYFRQVAWLDKEELYPNKIVFYDRRNDLFKTLTNKDYHQYLGQYWRANILEMVNHKTGKSTVLTFSNYKFNIGTSDADFTSNRLKSVR